MKDTAIADAHAEMYVALQQAALLAFLEQQPGFDPRLVQVASDVLIRMDDAYREVIAGEWI